MLHKSRPLPSRLTPTPTAARFLIGWTLTCLFASLGIAAEPIELGAFFEKHCIDCHSGDSPEGNISLADFDWKNIASGAEGLELALTKIRGRQMPPMDTEILESETLEDVVASLENVLDDYAEDHIYVGKTEAVRRLTRTEYQNAIRDLLDLEIDAKKLLPKDPGSHGFDNILVADLSPTLMDRYVNAAQRIARQAVGGVGRSVGGETIRIAPDITQEDRLPGLPLGTRGGVKVSYHFPQDGTYEFQLRLARDRNEHVEGIKREHEIQILIDRGLEKTFRVRPPKAGDHSQVDKHLQVRLPVTAGAHEVIVTFVKDSDSLIETMRQPLESKFNVHRHPRQTPALYEVTIIGPFDATGRGKTKSRDKVFIVEPDDANDELRCATKIVAHLTRRAFRRPVTDEDLKRPLGFYNRSRAQGEDFETAIESALASILVSPKFLFRIEIQPELPKTPEEPAVRNYLISDIELASRLSFFLWGSIPDEELLLLAEKNKLRDGPLLREQIERMLADPKAENLVSNFAAQWLYLRNLDSITPDARLFPDFDDNLRQAFRQETEHLFREVMQENQNVLHLIRSDHTFLNERLAKHYQIPHVYGSHFRRVDLPQDEPTLSIRGGILRHASLLTVTSYATRTSPVLRGNWILDNLLGNPAPPPPADVPALEDNTVAAGLPIRQRLAEHRDNEACAGCHQLIDPVGFSLENFDAIGRWREIESDIAIDATGALPGGESFEGVAGLEEAILDNPDWFVSTFASKLMTFGLGRGVEPRDGPSIRQVLRRAAEEDFRFASVIMGIVESPAFQMRSFE